jgi:hypothetical protein
MSGYETYDSGYLQKCISIYPTEYVLEDTQSPLIFDFRKSACRAKDDFQKFTTAFMVMKTNISIPTHSMVFLLPLNPMTMTLLDMNN